MSSHAMDCPLLYIIAHTYIHASYLLRRTSPLHLYYTSSACAISHKKALMYLTIHHTGISGISVYDLYIIHQTTQSILILCNTNIHKYGRTSVLQKVDVIFLVDEVFNCTRRLLYPMMVRSPAKHITFIAFTLKLVAPPKVHTTFQN